MPHFRPRLRFSLRTAFVVITLAGIPAWWLSAYLSARRADAAYREAQATWEAELITTDELCQSSRNLLAAELRVPLTDHHAARVRHSNRLTLLARKLEALDIVGLTGGSTDQNRSQIEQLKAEAERVLSEAN